MSLKGKFITSSLWSIAAALFNNLSSLATFVVLARVLTPSEFGTVAFAMIFITISRVFVIAGIPDALIRRAEWDDEYASTAFWTNLIISVAICLALSLGAAPLIVIYHDRTFGLVLAALSLLLVVEGLTTVHIAKLRRDFHHKVIASRMMLSNLIASVIGIWLALEGWGVWAMVLSRVVSAAATSFILWRSTQIRIHWRFSFEAIAEIFRFSRGILGSQLLNQAGAQLPALFLGAVLGSAAVAQFRVGGRIIELLISLVIAPLQTTAVSVLSRHGDDRESLARNYLRLTRGCAVITCPMFFGIAALAPDLVLFAFGPQWSAAGYVLMAMALIVGAATLGYFEAPTLNAAARTDLTFLTSLVGSLGNVVFGLVGVLMGPVGVAAALSLRAHATMPIALRLIRIATGVTSLRAVTNIAPPFLSAALMFGIVLIIRMQTTDMLALHWRLIACMAFGVAIYPAAMFIFFRRSSDEYLREALSLLPQGLMTRIGKGGR